MTIRAWRNGDAHTLSEAEWAEICATFLGCGFRVDLPGDPDRDDAARHEAGRVRRIADILGADLPEAAWELATAALPDRSVEVLGGWPRTYAGERAWWIAALPIGDDRDPTTAEVLPRPRSTSPTSGLPMFSRLMDEVALSTIQADCGLWADTDGSIVTSTAGPIIAQRAEGGWALSTESGGWAATRAAAQRGATTDLHVEDLATARLIGVIGPAGEVLPLRYRA